MKNNDWTRNEFLAYVLLYAAHCDYFEDSKELQFIFSKVDDQTFNRIHNEVVVDSEDQKLNKIQQYISDNNLTQIEKEVILRDIKQVFFADGTVDVFEKNLFAVLKKIIE
ncbi:MAG: hypothetical protein GW772_04565 [Flavobacteriia bacterium]|nr:hypothetical protein [Flavobacteriia bacterium]OIP48452.1 MAG: hypothetical protein AUK46_01545 [Flavobacteriaceae bacterium CG2_30_31_66]PIV97492.1 MAG: hypothetical protein COW43_02390 [Flavobacteriaceae bacterium CG17_big_fil_post_rev_8_21_14_2_50_31_13]PIX13067.1 MAG: hypothetical protein COZ74_08215 [Flavobacteriaceae bacterium CG_4_8_14_3_um_filter_31_8]PIY14306.1 MAG: hypothetical protein COZ16_09945 [Flavobacteriaceae bacterium CG_4_10_14_3_um_filter_31_253]PIZ10158.1 MAG: hypotheti